MLPDLTLELDVSGRLLLPGTAKKSEAHMRLSLRTSLTLKNPSRLQTPAVVGWWAVIGPEPGESSNRGMSASVLEIRMHSAGLMARR